MPGPDYQIKVGRVGSVRREMPMCSGVVKEPRSLVIDPGFDTDSILGMARQGSRCARGDLNTTGTPTTSRATPR